MLFADDDGDDGGIDEDDDGGGWPGLVVKHTSPTGAQVKSKAGTQSIGGWWATAKKNLFGTSAGNNAAIEEHFHEAQWTHWVADIDRWLACGTVLRDSFM